jgi:hypothetical protein
MEIIASFGAELETVEVAIRSSKAIGRTLGELISRMPEGVKALAVRVANENKHPEPGLILGEGDVL